MYFTLCDYKILQSTYFFNLKSLWEINNSNTCRHAAKYSSAATIAGIEQKGQGLRYLKFMYLVDELLNMYLHHIKDKGNDGAYDNERVHQIPNIT